MARRHGAGPECERGLVLLAALMMAVSCVTNQPVVEPPVVEPHPIPKRDRGEGIGLGSLGTLGHGAGPGTGQGFGPAPALNPADWTPPEPSSRFRLPTSLLPPSVLTGKASYDAIAKHLTDAESRAGYPAPSYLLVKGGFALINGAEVTNEDGETSKETRWRAEGRRVPPASFAVFLRRLFTSETGYHRVIIFVVSSEELTPQQQPVSQDDLKRLRTSGYDRLPKALRTKRFDPDTDSCVAWVYEFEKYNEEDSQVLVNPGRGAEVNPKNSGLWEALDAQEN